MVHIHVIANDLLYALWFRKGISMSLCLVRAKILPVVAGVFLVVALALSAQPAYASVREDLKDSYQAAVIKYESAVSAQDLNEAALVQVGADIAENERKTAQTEEQLGETAVSMYKGTRGSWVLVDLLLNAESFSDAVSRYDKYEKIEGYYRDKIDGLEQQRAIYNMRKAQLEVRKAELEEEVVAAKRAADEAALALLDNTHSDGADFHQRQSLGNNCGATAFIVAVNTILHENRYVDNAAVWSSPSFNGDSTTDLAWKGSNWLLANGLFDMISIETVAGDIHTAQQMRDWLEAGYIVLASSGSGSTWQRADGTQADAGSFPDGHWVTFYRYEDGVFYANDSSVDSAKGAGCPYDEAQMQQWLDGRSNHFATALKKR